MMRPCRQSGAAVPVPLALAQLLDPRGIEEQKQFVAISARRCPRITARPVLQRDVIAFGFLRWHYFAIMKDEFT
jgi:hypothetical protein